MLLQGGGQTGGRSQSPEDCFPPLANTCDYGLVCWGCLFTLIAGWLSITSCFAGGERRGEHRDLKLKDPFNQRKERQTHIIWGIFSYLKIPRHVRALGH